VKTALAIAGALFIGLIGGYWLSESTSATEGTTPGSQPDAALHERLDDVEVQIASLHRDVARRRDERAVRHAAADADVKGRDSASRPPSASVARVARRPALPTQDEVMGVLEDAFDSEAPDDRWASETQDALLAAFERGGSTLRPRSVECRSESCRLEFDADASPSQGDIALAISAAELGAWVVDSRDPDTVVVFAERESPDPGASL